MSSTQLGWVAATYAITMDKLGEDDKRSLDEAEPVVRRYKARWNCENTDPPHKDERGMAAQRLVASGTSVPPLKPARLFGNTAI